jgi:hypothetical protein
MSIIRILVNSLALLLMCIGHGICTLGGLCYMESRE